jgi:hypothetical protein
VLLPNDINRKPITSITTVLLPFVTYLLVLARTNTFYMNKWHLKFYVTCEALTSSNTTACDVSKGYQLLYESRGFVETNLFIKT